MWKKLRDCLVYGWRRTGDLSLIAWLFPNIWATVVSASFAAVTAFVGWATILPPVLWIFLALLAGLMALFIAHIWLWLKEREAQLKVISPLRIIFDTSNPYNRFWERISPRDKNGNSLPGVVLEYRVKVQNTSSKTVKNVRISKESSGLMPVMPIDLVFQKDGKQNRDLQPNCYEFVSIFWQFPPEAGDAWGETATALHGPIKIIASGDDVLPEECEFDYYPDQLPAIVPRQADRRNREIP